MLEDLSLVQRVEVIKELCTGKTVLHLGCTNYPYTEESIRDGMLLHFELDKIADDLWGLDADVNGLEILREKGVTQLIHADLENLEAVEREADFDVILAGEMIEHLNNPGAFLNGVARLMDRNTKLVITTVNAYCGMRFLWYGLRGKRGRNEFVHPDHVAYYSYSTLKLLLERHGMHVENFLFYDIGKEHRPHNRWYLNAANDLLVRIAPQWADGVIAVARLDKQR